MARYIDADKFMVALNDAQIEFSDTYEGLGRAKFLLSLQPTAEVVPKSEVEWFYKEVDRLSQVVLYHDAFKVDEIKDAKAEVAREIFEEIEENISPMLGLEDDKEYVAILATTFAELKKKYTGEKK